MNHSQESVALLQQKSLEVYSLEEHSQPAFPLCDHPHEGELGLASHILSFLGCVLGSRSPENLLNLEDGDR